TTSVHSSMSELNMCQTVMNMKPLYSPYPELRLLSEFVLPLIEFVFFKDEFILSLKEFRFSLSEFRLLKKFPEPLTAIR
ncbi:MAG TPA: hypothetical protein VL093_02135, partial [Flavipsychrobacter sp.]|nr:hypothetical protein [Flavipsychrobacter sp.]